MVISGFRFRFEERDEGGVSGFGLYGDGVVVMGVADEVAVFGPDDGGVDLVGVWFGFFDPLDRVV